MLTPQNEMQYLDPDFGVKPVREMVYDVSTTMEVEGVIRVVASSEEEARAMVRTMHGEDMLKRARDLEVMELLGTAVY